VRRAWEWFTDLGFGAWVLGGAVLLGLALVVALVAGRGDTRDTSCADAQRSETLIDRYDGQRLTARQAMRLHEAATHLRAVADRTHGTPQQVLRQAAQVAGSARAGRVFDAGFSYGRFQSVCDYADRGPERP